MNLINAPQPFQYQGSKRIIAGEVVRQLDLSRYDTLVEPFAGSAAVSIRAALEGDVSSFWINDANGPLVELLRSIVERPEWVVERYADLWDSQLADPKAFYLAVRERFNETQQPDDLLYLLSRAVKGCLLYTSPSPRDGLLSRMPSSA